MDFAAELGRISTARLETDDGAGKKMSRVRRRDASGERPLRQSRHGRGQIVLEQLQPLLDRVLSERVGALVHLSSFRATGEAYCLARHLTVDGPHRRLMVAALRYYDTYVKATGVWLFAERLLYVDWIEERAIS